MESLTQTTGSALLGPEEEHQRLDALEARILDLPPVHLPVVHTFTPYLYCRSISMSPGALLTSRVHVTTHQYAILRGVAHVLIPGQEPVRLAAGHAGVTHAGTRRALFIPTEDEDGEPITEPCVWNTYHPMTSEEEERRAAGASEQELVALVEERIIGRRERLDGRDVFAEYREKLDAAGLPGPHDGAGSPGLGSPDSESYSVVPEGGAIPSLPSAPGIRSQPSKGERSLP